MRYYYKVSEYKNAVDNNGDMPELFEATAEMDRMFEEGDYCDYHPLEGNGGYNADGSFKDPFQFESLAEASREMENTVNFAKLVSEWKERNACTM